MQHEDCVPPYERQQEGNMNHEPATICQYIVQAIVFIIGKIYQKICTVLRAIFNVIMFSICVVIFAVSFKLYSPDHMMSEQIDFMIANVTELFEHPTGQKAMLSMVESYQIHLLSGTKGIQDNNDISDIKYSYLKKFGDVIIGEYFNLTDVKTAIKNGPVPVSVSALVLERVIAGNYKYCPNSLDYTANEHKNGGTGFKYCLQIQKPREMYQIIYTVAGRLFEVASDVEYRKETIPEVVSITEQGFLGKYTSEKVMNTERYKMVVKPKYLSESQFETVVRQTYIEYAHDEATKQIEAELHHIRKMIAR